MLHGIETFPVKKKNKSWQFSILR